MLMGLRMRVTGREVFIEAASKETVQETLWSPDVSCDFLQDRHRVGAPTA